MPHEVGPTRPPAGPRGPGRPIARILVADDEPSILSEYTRVLGHPGEPDEADVALADLEAELFGEKEEPQEIGISFAVVACRQGEEAVTAVAEAVRSNQPFTVAFLDVRMPPGIDGVVTAERIRRIDPLIHIVFVTGHSDVRPDSLAPRLPPMDKLLYCQKPLQAWELKQLARALSAKWMAEETIRAMQARLHQRLDQMIASTSVVVYSSKLDTLEMTFVSPNVHKQFGHLPADLLSNARAWLERVHPEDEERLSSAFRRLRQAGEITCDYRLRHGDGEYRWVTDRMTLVVGPDGVPIEAVGCCLDIDEKRKSQEKIRYLAYFDSLTGLPNRTFMREFLDHCLARAQRYERRVAVLFIDIDHFKRVNDSLGHGAGDTLLQEVAARVQSCVRAADRVCRDVDLPLSEFAAPPAVSRLGGDEFVVILTEIKDDQDAAEVARRIVACLAAPICLEHDELSVTSSIGISVYPRDGDSAESLLKNADTAMYSAKSKGRDQFQFFTHELNERTKRRFSIERDLRRSLDQNGFSLHYQPKIDLKTDRVVGMEALLRLRQSESGLVSPMEFIPVAEELGLILPIGEWVFREACRQAAAWQDEGLPSLTVSVNLSAVQFRNRRLPVMIGDILGHSGLDPARLEIELTESMLIEDTGASVTMLARLREMSVRLSIDDFGTGYSSLSYLKRFPIDALKIDQSFIRDVTTDRNDSAIVSATISLAHTLGLQVVAEGVEHQVQADVLREQRCDMAQGYLFAAPLAPAEFRDWVMCRGSAALQPPMKVD